MNSRITFLSVLMAVSTTTLLLAQPAQQDHQPDHPRMPGRGVEWQDFAERHDVDGDGVVTSEELDETAQMLSRLDADGDGVISEADFDARRAEMATQMVVRKADGDRDGRITSQEWEAFGKSLDGDADGAFEVEDLENLRPEGARPGHPGKGQGDLQGRPEARRAGFHEDLAKALDLDGDDQLTTNDLDLLFLSLDEDGDGVIEAQTFRRMHHRGPGQ